MVERKLFWARAFAAVFAVAFIALAFCHVSGRQPQVPVVEAAEQSPDVDAALVLPRQATLGANTSDYFLQPRVRAQVLLTVNKKTIGKLNAAVAEFARLFPEGFTKTTFPRTAIDRTTLEGAWYDKAKQKTAYDKSEMLYVDFEPAECKDCLLRVARYKDYVARSFGESEVWVTLTPTWRMLTPASPDWAEVVKKAAK